MNFTVKKNWVQCEGVKHLKDFDFEKIGVPLKERNQYVTRKISNYELRSYVGHLLFYLTFIFLMQIYM